MKDLQIVILSDSIEIDVAANLESSVAAQIDDLDQHETKQLIQPEHEFLHDKNGTAIRSYQMAMHVGKENEEHPRNQCRISQSIPNSYATISEIPQTIKGNSTDHSTQARMSVQRIWNNNSVPQNETSTSGNE